MSSRIDVEPLLPGHVPAAARLFVERYRAQRRAVPALPAAHEDPAAIERLLAEVLAEASGVAALRGGQVCGYLSGMLIPEFMGRNRGAYCPIWAHAVVGGDVAGTYHRLYGAISSQWVKDGCLTHAVTVGADDAAGREAWFHDGFGMLVVDALRPLDPVAAPCPEGVHIRQATTDDVSLILPLDGDLSRYLTDGPVFLDADTGDRAEHYRQWLVQPAHTLWLAVQGGEAVGYMRSQPPGFGIAHIVRDPGTISISGAYVRPQQRGSGVAAALLAHVIEWGIANGYERCSVDFESTNVLGSRFWLHHFQPVCYSLIRRLDRAVLEGEHGGAA